MLSYLLKSTLSIVHGIGQCNFILYLYTYSVSKKTYFFSFYSFVSLEFGETKSCVTKKYFTFLYNYHSYTILKPGLALKKPVGLNQVV